MPQPLRAAARPLVHSAPAGSALLAQQLGDFVAAAAAEAVAARGHFVVALSGGSLPRALSDALRGRVDLDTPRWHVVLADERLVAPGHPDGNAATIGASVPELAAVAELLQADPALLASPEKCAADYEARLLALCDGVVDLVLLGMGPDGHTASLFPGHALLRETARLVAPIVDSPKPPSERITFTLPLIARARAAAFVCSGDSKAQLVAEALRQSAEGDDGLPPVGPLLPAALVRVREGGLPTWFLDDRASSQIPCN